MSHLSEAQFACNNRRFPHLIRLLLQVYPIKSWHRRLTVSSSPTTVSTASTPGRTTRRHRTMRLSCHVSSVCCSRRRRCLSPGVSLVPASPQRRRCCPTWPSACRRRHLSTGHPRRPPARPPSPQCNMFFGPRRRRRHCCRRLPRCPHFPWAHSQQPKGEYHRSKRVIQLTTRKFCDPCNNPGSDSVPRKCIRQYCIRSLMLVAQPTIYAQCSTAL